MRDLFICCFSFRIFKNISQNFIILENINTITYIHVYLCNNILIITLHKLRCVLISFTKENAIINFN